MEVKRFAEEEKTEKKQEWEEIAQIFHYNENSGIYKKLSLMRTKDGNVVLQAREGEKNKRSNTVLIQLNEQEISYLAMKLLSLVMI